MTDKIKILFLGASPKDVSQPRFTEEVRETEAEIWAASRRDQFSIESQWAVRPADLQRALLRFQPHIVHFSGHGSKNEEIVLEDDDGMSRPISKQALIRLFKVLKDNVRIIVLNSCYSRSQAEALSEVIDYTVGTSKAVKDKSAVAFAAAFYRALAFGRSVQVAFELAKIQIDMNGLSGTDIPVLMVREGVSSSESFLNQCEPLVTVTSLVQLG
jgi:CHAT domain-containing protein